jgi:hypothetical protein
MSPADFDGLMGHNRIAQPPRVIDGRHRHYHFGRDLLLKFHVVFERGMNFPDEGLDFSVAFDNFWRLLDVH